MLALKEQGEIVSEIYCFSECDATIFLKRPCVWLLRKICFKNDWLYDFNLLLSQIRNVSLELCTVKKWRH